MKKKELLSKKLYDLLKELEDSFADVQDDVDKVAKTIDDLFGIVYALEQIEDKINENK